LTCRCLCPACSVGACGCTRNSIATMREYWGQPEPEPSEGLKLHIPPRSGSQLWEAGLAQGDLVFAVDGDVVHTNAKLSAAIRSARTCPCRSSGPGEPRRSG
jgi:hypothetical protein